MGAFWTYFIDFFGGPAEPGRTPRPVAAEETLPPPGELSLQPETGARGPQSARNPRPSGEPVGASRAER